MERLFLAARTFNSPFFGLEWIILNSGNLQNAECTSYILWCSRIKCSPDSLPVFVSPVHHAPLCFNILIIHWRKTVKTEQTSVILWKHQFDKLPHLWKSNEVNLACYWVSCGKIFIITTSSSCRNRTESEDVGGNVRGIKTISFL